MVCLVRLCDTTFFKYSETKEILCFRNCLAKIQVSEYRIHKNVRSVKRKVVTRKSLNL